MNRPAIKTAVVEAERFLRAAKAFDDAEESNKADYQKRKASAPEYPFLYLRDANVEHAAMKRASMDLTRALARMRRP